MSFERSVHTSFTDEDLKRLKGAMMENSPTGYWFLHNDLTGLLTRLEAAEACVDALVSLIEFHDISKNTVSPNYSRAVLEAWRRAAGK